MHQIVWPNIFKEITRGSQDQLKILETRGNKKNYKAIENQKKTSQNQVYRSPHQ